MVHGDPAAEIRLHSSLAKGVQSPHVGTQKLLHFEYSQFFVYDFLAVILRSDADFLEFGPIFAPVGVDRPGREPESDQG